MFDSYKRNNYRILIPIKGEKWGKKNTDKVY